MPRDCAFILCLIIRIYSDLLRRIAAAPDEALRGDPIGTTPEKAVLVPSLPIVRVAVLDVAEFVTIPAPLSEPTD